MIDLMALIEQGENTYIDVECSFGTVRVYHVPDVVLFSVSTGNIEPELPVIQMKTATGYQERPAKAGDEEYEKYLVNREEYSNELYRLRTAAGFIEALKDAFDWSKCNISVPPPNKLALAMYNGNWPKSELLRKKAWLDWSVLYLRGDQDKILAAMTEMRQENEVSPDMVDEVKKNSV